MGKLLTIASEFEELFDKFEEINDYEPDTDADGNFIDDIGNRIDDVVECKNTMLEAWYDTLEGMEFEFNSVAENIAVYIKQLKSESEALEKEEKALKLRKEQKNRKINGLCDYLMTALNKMKLSKIDTVRAKITIKVNPESVVVENEKKLIEWAESTVGMDKILKYVEPTLRKTEIKNAIHAGSEVPFAHIERSKSLLIK